MISNYVLANPTTRVEWLRVLVQLGRVRIDPATDSQFDSVEVRKEIAGMEVYTANTNLLAAGYTLDEIAQVLGRPHLVDSGEIDGS